MNDKAYLNIRMNRQLHNKFQSASAYEGLKFLFTKQTQSGINPDWT